jgi:MerR family transcriptional regulator, aldehyde-responsive regulator
MSYYIKEVSEKTGLPTHTLRFYEKEGLIPYIRRDENGNRIYEEKNLSWLELIICLRKTDITLSNLRKIVELAKEGDKTIPHRKKILENHKLIMIEKQKELDRAFNKINEKIEYFDHLEKKYKEKEDNSTKKSNTP